MVVRRGPCNPAAEIGSCRLRSTGYGCYTGSIMFNHETVSASASPTRTERGTPVKMLFRDNREGNTGDMETGRKNNETTRLKGKNMMKVERQKQTPPVLQASQAIKPITRWISDQSIL